jgi:alpha-L-arabinofuranosidase
MQVFEKNRLAGDELNAVNSFEKPHQVGLRSAEALYEKQDGSFQTELPGYSWNRIQFVLVPG